MEKKHFHIGIVVIILLMAISCAQITSPEGGPPDEDPPEVTTEGSTPNSQVRFKDRKIELSFSEWITVKNTAKEIFVSPPLSYPLKVTDRGKKIIVEFNEEEVLKENTTYQINFGKAIADLTAGNALEDYTFKFATGDKLDELSIEGTVIDFKTQKASADVIVMLHDNLSDTCFTTIKPTYLCRTDKEGHFKLENLRADSFQIFGLVDGNVSYTYDVQTELIAFGDSLIVLTEDQAPLLYIQLDLFDEEDEPRFIEARQRQQGLIKIVYQPALRSASVAFLEERDVQTYTELKGDTVLFWHSEMEADSLNLVVKQNNGIDTMKVKKAKKSIKKTQLISTTKRLSLLAGDTIKVEWNKPIMAIDTSKITFRDTTQTYAIKAFGETAKTTWFLVDLATATSYEMKMDSAAIEDWYGVVNIDSLDVSIITIDPEQLGTINLSITKGDSLSYLIEMKQIEEEIESWTILESEDKRISGLGQGIYTLHIIQDSNEDGRWSSGSWMEKRKPELERVVTLESLKAGWELEATVDLTELFYGIKGK